MISQFSRRMVLAFGVLLFSLTVSGCATPASTSSNTESNDAVDGSGPPKAPPTDTALVEYLWNTWGIRLSGYTGWAENFQETGGGAWTTTMTGDTELKGIGKHTMAIEEIVQPIGAGTDVSIFITDTEANVQRYFQYNAAEGYVTIGTVEKSVSVSAQEDGSFTVWTYDASSGKEKENTTEVADGYAAFKTVAEFNGLKDIPPHILLTAFAVAHTDIPAARTPTSCTNTASTPPVCTLFKAFCDCSACKALDRTDGDCSKCPSL
ncbi:MAG: hypothetical protein H6747_01265 [Deltaproteobacteria bacterium]|nr:hypothetical protein [Deltaproteobacteria bacterium]